MRKAWAILVAAAALACAAEPRWTLKYFYDEDRSSLAIQDLSFPSPQRGIAVGAIERQGKGKPAPTAVVTSDGGKTWRLEPLKELPVSLFFLNDSRGWMVTTKGVWVTDEGGAQWRKVSGKRDLIRLYFITPDHGWAVGPNKTVVETHDGGKSWTDVPDAAKPQTTAEYTTYSWVEFVTPQVGMIIGRSHKPAPRSSSDDPESRPEMPGLLVVLETRDGGKTWTANTASVFGRVARVRAEPNGNALALFEFDHAFAFPSEILHLDMKTGVSSRVLARKDFAATDVVLGPNGSAYAFGHESRGILAQAVPGKLRVLRSDGNLKLWREMPVDYRAVATRVVAANEGDNLWIATDTGMILKLEGQ